MSELQVQVQLQVHVQVQVKVQVQVQVQVKIHTKAQNRKTYFVLAVCGISLMIIAEF